MSLIVSLIVAVAFTLIFRKPLQIAPWLFYVLAVVVCAAGIYFTYSPSPSQAIRSVVFVVQKGRIGFALLAVVMFIGVLGRSSALRRRLTPIRAELSIIASILIAGHLAPYLSNYLGSISGFFSLAPSIMSSLIIALVMLVLLVLLVVTSFNSVKKRMNAGRWKTVQKLAYPFFGLIFFHLLGYLMIPALKGSTSALTDIVVYGSVFVIYAVLRIRKALNDKRLPQMAVQNGGEQAADLKAI